jgi:hypothetical protein
MNIRLSKRLPKGWSRQDKNQIDYDVALKIIEASDPKIGKGCILDYAAWFDPLGNAMRFDILYENGVILSWRAKANGDAVIIETMPKFTIHVGGRDGT